MPVACIVNIGPFRRNLIQWPLEAMMRSHENPLVFRASINDFHDVDFTASGPNTVG